MSRLFAATGQNTRKTSGKRAIDTEILLREVQSRPRTSERYRQAVARMNYLHARYRKAGKILDEDLLHTLGDNVVEIFRIVDGSEWRKLSDVEKCAIGIFHKNLGDDMEIPLTALPSSRTGWKDGLDFATELRAWTIEYGHRAAIPNKTSDEYVRVYVDGATSKLPKPFTTLARQILGFELDEVMRTSLNLEAPGLVLHGALIAWRELRRVALRYLYLPRPTCLAVKNLEESPNKRSGLYNFSQFSLQPWYVEPSTWNKWGPKALLFRAIGGRTPGSRGDTYHPQGYDLQTIGPKPQEGKGAEEMAATIEYLKRSGTSQCPFAHSKQG
ncbi:Mycophenolic acid synthesis protein B [Paramyrothecium foliicola]|nr:Mycophenolic acid synthesis protein B [Paramyrothecium foliicola]